MRDPFRRGLLVGIHTGFDSMSIPVRRHLVTPFVFFAVQNRHVNSYARMRLRNSWRPSHVRPEDL